MTFIVAKRAISEVQGATPTLVASQFPHEHPTEEAAATEARRLSRENPSWEFYVLRAVSKHRARITFVDEPIE